LQHLILSCDRGCQIYTGSSPLFNEPEDLPKTKPPVRIPPGFQTITQSPHASNELTAILSDASSATLIKMFTGYTGTTPAELAFTDTQCHEIERHITQLSPPSFSSSSSTTSQESRLNDATTPSAIETCVCYGIWTYRALMLRSIPPDTSTCTTLGEDLRAALLRTQGQLHWRGRERLDLLRWIIFMGAHTVSAGQLRQWYVALLRGVSVHRGNVMSWDEARGTLSKFLWIERCEMLGKDLWDEVEGDKRAASLLESG